jgi:hypothetical protein
VPFDTYEPGLTKHSERTYEVVMSTPERAMIELCQGVPQQVEADDAYTLMYGLTNLRPNLVQSLLEKCTSVKAKRVFMVLAELCEHRWLKSLDLSQVDFGSGKRVIGNNGKWFSRYELYLPLDRDLLGTST